MLWLWCAGSGRLGAPRSSNSLWWPRSGEWPRPRSRRRRTSARDTAARTPRRGSDRGTRAHRTGRPRRGKSPYTSCRIFMMFVFGEIGLTTKRSVWNPRFDQDWLNLIHMCLFGRCVDFLRIQKDHMPMTSHFGRGQWMGIQSLSVGVYKFGELGSK